MNSVKEFAENEAQVAEEKRLRLLQERRKSQEDVIELSSDDECIIDEEKRKWSSE